MQPWRKIDDWDQVTFPAWIAVESTKQIGFYANREILTSSQPFWRLATHWQPTIVPPPPTPQSEIEKQNAELKRLMKRLIDTLSCHNFGEHFPTLTHYDMANALRKVVSDQGIDLDK